MHYAFDSPSARPTAPIEESFVSSHDDQIRSKALTAMKAVTASAILFAGVACSSESDTTRDVGWNVDQQDTAVSDTSDAVATADADNGEDCNDEESTGVCPDHCTQDNDVDCCESSGMYEWWDDGCYAVAVPGPFVPPSMKA